MLLSKSCFSKGFIGGGAFRLKPALKGRVGRCDRQRIAPHAKQAGGFGEEELDVAVFRFTLGIPGFDDSNIPRIVGAAGVFLLAANHWATGTGITHAQERSEILGLVLCLTCIVAPTIESRLKELQPGRGRRQASAIPDTQQGFLLSEGLDDAVKQELAWTSYALLKNTNSCSIFLWKSGEVIMARGALPIEIVKGPDKAASLTQLSKDVSAMVRSSPPLASLFTKASAVKVLNLPDRGKIDTVAKTGTSILPSGVRSMLIQTLEPFDPKSGSDPPEAALILLSDQERAWSERERYWVTSICAKLFDVLCSA
ncbi:hypothetical protein BSKO_13982 [Bryopsis sp. KO-2023]|nr:hypothetical protein BSKO_13982 [Bryopsis sp. KO-2023]